MESKISQNLKNESPIQLIIGFFEVKLLRAKKPPFPFFRLIVCKTSWRMTLLSLMERFGTNADCGGQMILGSKGLSLLAKILEMTL